MTLPSKLQKKVTLQDKSVVSPVRSGAQTERSGKGVQSPKGGMTPMRKGSAKALNTSGRNK